MDGGLSVMEPDAQPSFHTIATTPGLSQTVFATLELADLAALHLTVRELCPPSPELTHLALALLPKRPNARDVRACVAARGKSTKPGVKRLLTLLLRRGDEEGEELCHRAACLLALLAEEVRQPAAALALWRKAAHLGSPDAQLHCGLSAYGATCGMGDVRLHPDEAREFLIRAAANASADAWTRATALLYMGLYRLHGFEIFPADAELADATKYIELALEAATSGEVAAEDAEEKTALHSLASEARYELRFIRSSLVTRRMPAPAGDLF